MRFGIRNSRSAMMQCAIGLALLGGLLNTDAQQFESGKKAKVTGIIQSRNGDLVTVSVKKTRNIAVIDLTDTTQIERKEDFRLRHADMDITAIVPGLTIDVDGVGNAKGQLE